MPNWGTASSNGNVNRRSNWSKGTPGVIKDVIKNVCNNDLTKTRSRAELHAPVLDTYAITMFILLSLVFFPSVFVIKNSTSQSQLMFITGCIFDISKFLNSEG